MATAPENWEMIKALFEEALRLGPCRATCIFPENLL